MGYGFAWGYESPTRTPPPTKPTDLPAGFPYPWQSLVERMIASTGAAVASSQVALEATSETFTRIDWAGAWSKRVWGGFRDDRC